MRRFTDSSLENQAVSPLRGRAHRTGWWATAALSVCVATLILSTGIARADTLDQSMTQIDREKPALVGGPESVWGESLAQTFTAGLSGPLDRIKLYLGEPVASLDEHDVTVEITDTVGGSPGSTVLASALVEPSQMSEHEGSWVEVKFSSPPTVIAGTRYAIVVYAAGKDEYGWWAAPPETTYGGGGVYWSGSPPASWGRESFFSATGFETYVGPRTPTTLTYTGPSAGEYSGQATLSATLVDGGGPVSGQRVSFTLANLGCSAVTDAAGEASCQVKLEESPASRQLTVSYGGDGTDARVQPVRLSRSSAPQAGSPTPAPRAAPTPRARGCRRS